MHTTSKGYGCGLLLFWTCDSTAPRPVSSVKLQSNHKYATTGASVVLWFWLSKLFFTAAVSVKYSSFLVNWWSGWTNLANDGTSLLYCDGIPRNHLVPWTALRVANSFTALTCSLLVFKAQIWHFCQIIQHLDDTNGTSSPCTKKMERRWSHRNSFLKAKLTIVTKRKPSNTIQNLQKHLYLVMLFVGMGLNSLGDPDIHHSCWHVRLVVGLSGGGGWSWGEAVVREWAGIGIV